MEFSENLFKQIPIVGILRGISKHLVMPVLSNYFEVGFTTIEITMNTEGATEMISSAVDLFGEQGNIGAGTVRDLRELELALEAGAQFIVTPILDKAVIEACAQRNVPIFPGAYTPTEVYTAWKLGATAVKVFPAATGGFSHIKAIKAPLEMIPIIPTGGVNTENLSQFFNLGIYGVGMGSQLFPSQLIAEQKWEALKEQLLRVKSAFDDWKETV